MSRFKLLAENILVYGLGGSISKLIPFLLLPFITRLLPDAKYYGYFDILNIIISFSTSIAILGLYDMMFRMFFEEDSINYKKKVCSSAFFPVVVSGLLFFLGLVFFSDVFSIYLFETNGLSVLILIAAVTTYVNSLNVIVSAPTRMENKKKIYLTVNILTTLISYGISIFLLLKGYFLLALPLGLLTSNLFSLVVYSKLNFKWFSYKAFDFKLTKQLLRLGLPLVPVFLFYWVFNSFDRFMITKMLGDTFLGVYAIGAKVSSVSQLIYTAFAMGWQYFAFSTMKDKDQVELTSKVFEYLGIISFSAVIIIIPFVKSFFNIFFEEEYANGANVVPYLFLSPLILMLFQVGGNQFLVIKKTFYFGFILLLGAIINIFFNYFFIPMLGIEGAAIATLLGYLFSTITASILLVKLKLLNISFRFIVCFITTIVFIILSRAYQNSYIFFAVFCSFLIFTFLYKKDISMYYNKIKIKITKK